jgi:23S rRNA pseudoU1915 N3-methylase RlmH
MDSTVKYRIISVGKIREPYIAAAVEDFRKRLRRYVPLDEIEITPSHGGDPARAMREEAERILEQIAPTSLGFWNAAERLFPARSSRSG